MKQNTPFSKKEKVKGKEKSEKVGSNVSAGRAIPSEWMKKIQYSTENSDLSGKISTLNLYLKIFL